MSIIGNFKHNAKTDSYTGDIVTLTFSRTNVQFTPNEKSGDKEPDYRIVGKTAHGTSSSARRGSARASGAGLPVRLDRRPGAAGIAERGAVHRRGWRTATLVWTRPGSRRARSKLTKAEKPPDASHRPGRSRGRGFLRGEQLMMKRDYYDVLDVRPDATQGEIKRPVARLAKRWHPDRNPHAECRIRDFQEINEAHECLKDDDETRRV